MPPQANRKCQHTHNIFTYDASNNDIQQFLNKSSIEVKICNDPNLFRKIEFAKVVAVWMTKTSDQMTDFVRVTSKNKIGESLTGFGSKVIYIQTKVNLSCGRTSRLPNPKISYSKNFLKNSKSRM